MASPLMPTISSTSGISSNAELMKDVYFWDKMVAFDYGLTDLGANEMLKGYLK